MFKKKVLGILIGTAVLINSCIPMAGLISQKALADGTWTPMTVDFSECTPGSIDSTPAGYTSPNGFHLHGYRNKGFNVVNNTNYPSQVIQTNNVANEWLFITRPGGFDLTSIDVACYNGTAMGGQTVYGYKADGTRVTTSISSTSSYALQTKTFDPATWSNLSYVWISCTTNITLDNLKFNAPNNSNRRTIDFEDSNDISDVSLLTSPKNGSVFNPYQRLGYELYNADTNPPNNQQINLTAEWHYPGHVLYVGSGKTLHLSRHDGQPFKFDSFSFGSNANSTAIPSPTPLITPFPVSIQVTGHTSTGDLGPVTDTMIGATNWQYGQKIVNLNWDNVTYVDIKCTSGQSMFDDFVMEDNYTYTPPVPVVSPAPPADSVTVDFSDYASGTSYASSTGYTFVGGTGTQPDTEWTRWLKPYPQSKNKMFTMTGKNSSLTITKTAGGMFKMISFNYANSVNFSTTNVSSGTNLTSTRSYGVITGYVSNQPVYSSFIDTSSSDWALKTLNWNVDKVTITYPGGRYTGDPGQPGCYDNFVIGTTSVAMPVTITGVDTSNNLFNSMTIVNSTQTGDAQPIIVQYDATGRITQIDMPTIVPLTGSNQTISLGSTVTKVAGNTFKVFLWDGINTMKPLAEPALN